MSAATSLRWLVADSLVLARRSLEHVRQIPEKLLDVTLQPIMFTLLFAYVFGGVIAIPDGDYREYLLGGVMVQSLGFGLIGPATSIATDLNEGVIDRLRTQWAGTFLGLFVRSPDAAQGIVFMVVFPMTFLASTFVPLGGLSPVLRTIASWNPISALAAAVRELFGNPTGTPPDPAWPLRHAVLLAFAWSLALLALCVPLAIRRFRARTTG